MILSCVNQQFHARQFRKSRVIRLFGFGSFVSSTSCTSLLPLSPIFRTFFHVPYPATPFFATLTKTAVVCTNNSHSGTPRTALTFGRSDLQTFQRIWDLSPFFPHSCALFGTAKDSTLFF